MIVMGLLALRAPYVTTVTTSAEPLMLTILTYRPQTLRLTRRSSGMQRYIRAHTHTHPRTHTHTHTHRDTRTLGLHTPPFGLVQIPVLGFLESLDCSQESGQIATPSRTHSSVIHPFILIPTVRKQP